MEEKKSPGGEKTGGMKAEGLFGCGSVKKPRNLPSQT